MVAAGQRNLFGKHRRIYMRGDINSSGRHTLLQRVTRKICLLSRFDPMAKMILRDREIDPAGTSLSIVFLNMFFRLY